MSKYLVSLPQSQRSQYLENENVDFLMDFEGFTLKPNSVKLTGTLVVSQDPSDQPISSISSKSIFMDGTTGIDACFQSFTTSVGSKVVENNLEYPRFQKMNMSASQSKAQLVGSVENVSALRMYNDELTANIAEGLYNDGKVPFCFKPNIGLNNSQGLNGNSQVRLSLRLASTRDVFYGGDVDAGTSYWLEGIRVEYEVMPQGAKPVKGFMLANYSLKQVINNGNANLSMVVPVPSSKISCSMIQTDHLNTTDYNNLALEKPENVTRVELHINDGTSQVVSYPLETEQEILAEYLRSLGQHKHNTVTIKDLMANRQFGFGYSYTTMMKGSKIGLQIESDLSTPYAVYSYFSSVLEL